MIEPMRVLIIVLLLMLSFISQAQKPALDSGTFGKWPLLRNISITDDGNYSMYIIDNRMDKTHSLVVRSNTSDWQKEIAGDVKTANFTPDSKRLFFLDNSNHLGRIRLGSAEVVYTAGIKSFSICGSASAEWLARLGAHDFLTVEDLTTGKEKSFSEVNWYQFSADGKRLVLKCRESAGGPEQSIWWFDLVSGRVLDIWEGMAADKIMLTATGLSVGFLQSGGKSPDSGATLYYFQEGMEKATQVKTDKLPGGITGLAFNRTGDKMLVTLSANSDPKDVARPGSPNVDIWNYKDEQLQSEQLSKDVGSPNYPPQVIVNLTNGNSYPANPGNARISNDRDFDRWLLAIVHSGSDRGYYDSAAQGYISLVSASDGRVQRVARQKPGMEPVLSPDERYMLWFDPDSLHYFAYETGSGVTRNISAGVPVPLYDEEAVAIGRRSASFDVAGWDKDGKAVYLYDKYDLWKVSLDGSAAAVCMTNGYGRKNGIVFGLAETVKFGPVLVLQSGDTWVLSGFDRRSKYNGFWELNTRKASDPVKKNMDPYCYTIIRTGDIGNIVYARGNVWIKAKDAKVYLVQRMSASEYPNLYVTRDFLSYRPLSDLHPEKKYNWVTARLVRWKMSDGNMSQGILYLPEDFDSTRKYPLLFNYYEKESDQLFQYITPDWMSALINVPYFVSNGYLMFLPDIYYKPDNNGDGVLNAVISAAHYLCSFPWVDSTRLGLQGHSFAGFETNYLITHSHLFAAAGTGAGVSDVVSAYDQLNATGSGRQGFYELSSQGTPYGLNVTPWTQPDVYIRNSPIFSVGGVTTPLLIMHGDADWAVPFAQGIEMFLAMKRAGKKVWLLQYEKENHFLNGADAKDYTIRVKQFFDYYLKSAPAPVWMTRGVPANKKYIETGLKPDKSGERP
jgi:dipeptidyl aminopeptidase/acylaminoacyl peptidase